MAEANEGTKKCPECGESPKADASLCRFCGYVFTTGKVAKSSVTGRTQAQPHGRVPDWLKLLWPLALIVGILVVFLPTIARKAGNDPMATWEQALNQTRPQTSYDATFEQMFSQGHPQQEQSVDIRAFDGVCLMNFSKPVGGLLQRAAAKLLAQSVALSYSSIRKVNGDDPDVSAIVYSTGEKLLTVEVKNGKPK